MKNNRLAFGSSTMKPILSPRYADGHHRDIGRSSTVASRWLTPKICRDATRHGCAGGCDELGVWGLNRDLRSCDHAAIRIFRRVACLRWLSKRRSRAWERGPTPDVFVASLRTAARSHEQKRAATPAKRRRSKATVLRARHRRRSRARQ